MPLPLWGKLAAFSLGKKVAVLLLAKVYGIPKLYRRTQKGARFLLKHDPATRKLWARRIELGFRLPDRLVSTLKSLSWSRSASAARSSTSSALPQLPSLAPASTSTIAHRLPVHLRLATSLHSEVRYKALPSSRFQLLATSLRARMKAASYALQQQRIHHPRLTSGRTVPFLSQLPPRPPLLPSSLTWTPYPFGSFASQQLHPAPALGRVRPPLSSMSQQLLHRVATSLLSAHAEAGLARQAAAARGREYLRQTVARRRERRRQRYWQRVQLGAA